MEMQLVAIPIIAKFLRPMPHSFTCSGPQFSVITPHCIPVVCPTIAVLKLSLVILSLRAGVRALPTAAKLHFSFTGTMMVALPGTAMQLEEFPTLS